MGFQQYVILAGDRRTSELFIRPFYNLPRIKYDVMFLHPAFLEDNKKDSYINRLFGATYIGFFNFNSAFFGWKMSANCIELYACTNNNNNFKYHKLANISYGEIFSLTIKSTNNCFTFSIFDINNIVVCFYSVNINNNFKLGFENSLLIANPAGVNYDVRIVMNRKY